MFKECKKAEDCFKPGGEHMTLDDLIEKDAMSKNSDYMQKEIHRIHQFYKRVTDLAEANHKTAASLVEENGQLETENEGLKEFCQELLTSLADLEGECSHVRRKVRAAVLELIPHQKENNNDRTIHAN